MSNDICVLCGKQPYRIIGTLPSAVPGWWREQTIRQCTTCGLVSLEPLPMANEVTQLYNHTYYYQDAHIPPQYWISRAYWQFQDHFKNLPPARLLEIGCNNGFLLALAREQGWNIQGVEISETVSRNARIDYDLPIFTGTLEEYAQHHEQKFDVICAFALIEHVLDPVTFLRTCRQLITESGTLILTMPNWNAWIRRLRSGKWGGYQGYHLYYFNHRTLSKCLERCGFCIEKVWNIHDDDILNPYLALLWMKPIFWALCPRRPTATSKLQGLSLEQAKQLMHDTALLPRYSRIERLQALLNWPWRKAMDFFLAGNAFGVYARPTLKVTGEEAQ